MPRPLRTLLLVLAVLLAAAPALAERPSGDYAITIDDPEIFRPTGVPDGTCATLGGIDVCIDGFVAGPNSTGSGSVGSLMLLHAEGDVEGNFTGALYGTIAGPVAKPRLRLRMIADNFGPITFAGVPISAHFGGPFRCSAKPSIESLVCRGRALFCATENASGRVVGCASQPFEFALEQQGGPWQIRLADLATDEKGAITGTAEVELTAGRVDGGVVTPLIVTYGVTGKYDARRDRSVLKLVGATDNASKSRLKLSRLTLEGGTATGGKVAFRIGGQTGKAEIVAPVAAPEGLAR